MASADQVTRGHDGQAIRTDPRREQLVASLRSRYAIAAQRDDAASKQALFREGVYLNILPKEFIDPS